MELITADVQQDEFFHPPEIPDTFKKAVGLVQVAMGKLGFLHRKLYNVLLANAYEGLGEGKTQFAIQVSSLAELSGFESRDYQMIYDHCKDLLETSVEFIEFDNKENGKKRSRRRRGASTLISDFAVTEGGLVTYSYSLEIAKKLYEPEQYIWMAISAQNRFSSKYELNLFENCIRYIGSGSTGFKDVSSWRALLGAEEKTYAEFKELNKKVLKPASKGVNSKSGILVEPEFEREKRKVARIKFKVTENPQMQLLDHKEHSKIRATEVFRKARELGLKEIEAIYWIESKGERYLSETIAYVEAKKTKQNPTGYLVDALKNGYGEKSPKQRQKEAETHKRVGEAKKQREATKKVLRKAIECCYWQLRYRNEERTQDKKLRQKLMAMDDQETLKVQFLDQFGEDSGYKVGDFKKLGWESVMCGREIKEFAAELMGEALTNEQAFYKAEKVDIEQLQVAYAEIENSIYRQKLDDADSALSGKENVDLDELVERIF